MPSVGANLQATDYFIWFYHFGNGAVLAYADIDSEHWLACLLVTRASPFQTGGQRQQNFLHPAILPASPTHRLLVSLAICFLLSLSLS